MRRCIIGIIAAACLLLCTACGESSVLPFEKRPIQQKTTTLTTVTEETVPEVTTDELDRRIGVIYDLQPVPVPEGGWTDKTLLPTICVGGECGKYPVCLADLLYGYTLTGEHADYYTEHAAEIFSRELTFAGTQCSLYNAFGELEFLPRTETHNPAMPEGSDDRTLDLEAEWCVITEDGENRLTFSVNCVTIGTPFEDVKKRIGFGENDRAPGSDDGFSGFTVHVNTESISIVFTGEDTVSAIMLNGVPVESE